MMDKKIRIIMKQESEIPDVVTKRMEDTFEHLAELKKQTNFYGLEDVEQGSCDSKIETFEWQEILLFLEESSRIIVQLYYYEELSIKEIADVLKMNKNTVTTKLSRARKKLRSFL